MAAPLGPEARGEPIPPAGPAVTPHDTPIFNAAGALRLHLGQKYNERHRLLNPRDFRCLWVTDFPMLNGASRIGVGGCASPLHLAP